VRDANAAWKLGIPAVVLVHEPFATIAKVQAEALGARDPLIVVYKQDAPVFESAQQITDKARNVAAEVLKLLETA
jgi:hypothetical protein